MGPVAAVVGVIAAVASVVGGVVQYFSNQRQADAAKRQGEQQAAAAEANAAAARAAAGLEEYKHRYRLGYMLGEQQAKFGKAGVVNEGTPLAVMEETAYQSELDAMAIKFGGDVAVQRNLAQAQAYRSAGDTMAQSYQAQAGTSLLTGFSTGLGQAVGGWDAWKQYKAGKT